MVSTGGSFAASLLDVAIRAAVQSGAPRRTVAATAAAVTTSVMMAQRGDTGVCGAAAAKPTASQRRRTKRKKKASREAKAAASPLPQQERSMDVENVHAGGDGTSPSVAPASSPGPTTPLPPQQDLSSQMPRNMCQYCGQIFEARNGLFRHLKESGHDQFFAPSAADCESIAGMSVTSATQAATLSEQAGGASGPAALGSSSPAIPPPSPRAQRRLGRGKRPL